MNQKTYQLTLNFDQILDLVKQLPESDKIQLSAIADLVGCVNINVTHHPT